MISFLSLACGAFAAGGTYLLLRRRLFDFLIGLTLIGHAVNLAVFVVGTPEASSAPLIGANETNLALGAVDPVPQALVLTAIVISFGTTAFLAVLLRTSLKAEGLREIDPPAEGTL